MSNALAIYQDFNTLKNIATTLAQSDLIPTHFQRKPANVMIALEFAHRNDIAPFAAMQSIFVVHGKPGMSAAMAISLARKHNVFKNLTYKSFGEGDTLAVTAVASMHDGSEVISTVTFEMAKKAGWTKNAVYNSIPEQMLRYRAAVFLIRAHFPEVLFGMSTKEELEDIVAAKTNPELVNVTPDISVIEAVQNEVEETAPVIEQQKQEAKEEPETAPAEQERDIEDMRGELTEFISSRPNDWFGKIGKDKITMLQAIESEINESKMKTMYDRVQQYDKLANM